MQESNDTTFALSLGTALIFTLTILVQLIFAHLGYPDIAWIVIGLIGVGLGFIGLYVYYSKTIIVFGFGVLMTLCFTYILYLYLVVYGLGVIYGIMMPITITSILGLVCSVAVSVLGILDRENDWFPLDRPDVGKNKEKIRFIGTITSEVIGILSVVFTFI